jgi:putative membrane protein insertion efficiency factor
VLIKFLRSAAVFPINIYRNYFSPFKIRCCRFHPSCSEYACLAIEKYGIVKGTLKSAWRILRCNPFSSGGHDPV